MNWFKLSEKLPPLDTPVLFTDGKQQLVGERTLADYRSVGWRIDAVGISANDFSWDFDYDLCTDEYPITHWMHLPPLPNK